MLALAQPALACNFSDGRFHEGPAADDLRTSQDEKVAGEALFDRLGVGSKEGCFASIVRWAMSPRLLATTLFAVTHALLGDAGRVGGATARGARGRRP